MKLLIDAGNTRIKWALTDGMAWLRNGACLTAQMDGLRQQLVDIQGVQQIWVSNVAGDDVARQLRGLCSEGAAAPHFIAARAVQCGVRNGYADPAQLGSDRWAALIAAWHLMLGRCLVVGCGTATTVDALSADGEFIGGLILPGVELMQRSLGEATAGLQPEPGNYAPFPRNTADAMFSGAVQAVCGAIERQHALLGPETPVILSGGATAQLQTRLNLPLRLVDNLVLHGVSLIAQEEGA